MTLVKLNRKPVERDFSGFVDSLFTELPGFFQNGWNQAAGKSFAPVNIKETEKNYQLDLVAPGFDKADFKIDLNQDALTISAEKKEGQKEENENGKKIREEYTYRSFKRTFTLDEKIDATAIDASYINGVLTLNLPKKEAVKVPVQQITIK